MLYSAVAHDKSLALSYTMHAITVVLVVLACLEFYYVHARCLVIKQNGDQLQTSSCGFVEEWYKSDAISIFFLNTCCIEHKSFNLILLKSENSRRNWNHWLLLLTVLY